MFATKNTNTPSPLANEVTPADIPSASLQSIRGVIPTPRRSFFPRSRGDLRMETLVSSFETEVWDCVYWPELLAIVRERRAALNEGIVGGYLTSEGAAWIREDLKGLEEEDKE